MKLAFSTLGCPGWGIAEIADAASRLGYHGIELRCLGGDLDLLARPELRSDAISSSRALLHGRGLSVVCVDSSACFHDPDPAERARNRAAALAHARLAASLGAPLVRVFPNEIPAGSSREETRDRIAAELAVAAAELPRGIRFALETHGDFATAADAADVVERAAHPSLCVVWDAANTIAAGEAVAFSLRRLGPLLAHVHLRDACPVDGERFWKPVLAGRGRVPLREIVSLLVACGYQGTVSFEWEKHWRPDLEEPEVAFADFIAALRGGGFVAEAAC